MALCDLCDQEMTTAATCSISELHRDGRSVAVLTYGSEPGWRNGPDRCNDCGAARGRFHHPGCDVQRCPECFGQLISCDCAWDELGGDMDPDDADPDEVDTADVLERRSRGTRRTAATARPPLGAVVAPLRARHRAELRRLAAWSLARGRRCDRDVAAVCLEALAERRTPDGRVLLDRPTVNQILWADVWNLTMSLGALVPEGWQVELWIVLGWLHDDGHLAPSSDPLDVLREPLRCVGGLGTDGVPMPDGEDIDFACQCYVPHDPTLPPGIGLHIVGHDPESFEPYLARARLRPRNVSPAMVDLEPLFAFARHLRGERAHVAVHVENFSFVGVAPADRGSPELWLYHHDPTGRRGFPPLVLDADARPWVPHPDRRRRVRFRWERARDVLAVYRSGAGREEAGDDYGRSNWDQ